MYRRVDWKCMTWIWRTIKIRGGGLKCRTWKGRTLPDAKFFCSLFISNKLCRRPPQYAPAPARWPFDLESGVRVTCAVDYLCAKFSFPMSLCSRLRPDVRDRQTDVRRASSSFNASALLGRVIIFRFIAFDCCTDFGIVMRAFIF